MVIRTEHNTHSIHLSEFDAVCLETQTAYLSAYLLSELAKTKYPLLSPMNGIIPLVNYYRFLARITYSNDPTSNYNGVNRPKNVYGSKLLCIK